VNPGARAGLGSGRLIQALIVFTAVTVGVSALVRRLTHRVDGTTECAGAAIAGMSADGASCESGLTSVPAAVPEVLHGGE
jgi:hypothetical protein